MAGPLLSVRNLTVAFDTRRGPFDAVRDVSFDVGAGQTLGVVGESGSGKSVTAMALMQLLPDTAATWGNILAEGNTRLFIAPWIANFAGLSIIALVWGVNMLGNGLREHYDPKMVGR